MRQSPGAALASKKDEVVRCETFEIRTTQGTIAPK